MAKMLWTDGARESGEFEIFLFSKFPPSKTRNAAEFLLCHFQKSAQDVHKNLAIMYIFAKEAE